MAVQNRNEMVMHAMKDEIKDLRSELQSARDSEAALHKTWQADQNELAALAARVREAEQRWEDLQRATEQACRERDAAVGEVVRLRETIREHLSAPIWGHSHWDATQRHGAGCTLCIAQHEASGKLRAALATPAASEGEGNK